MKKQARQKAAVLFAIVGLAMMLLAINSQPQCHPIAQNETQAGWRVYSPPDKSFTVEVPREMRRTNDLDHIRSSEESFFECTRSAVSYTLQLKPEAPENVFAIGVFDVSGCRRKPKAFNEEVEGVIPIVGGDDKIITSNSKVSVDRLPAHEFTYEKGDIHGRVLIVNAGKRIYLLTYTTEFPGGISSPEAARMFKTFHPAKH